MSELKVNKISPATGTAFQLGDSGDTFTIPSGATIVNSGTATNFGSAAKCGQVVQAHKSDVSSFTSQNAIYNIPGLAVTITPAAASSKILILGTLNSNCTTVDGVMQVTRNVAGGGATSIGASTVGVGQPGISGLGGHRNGYELMSAGTTYIDTPTYTLGQSIVYQMGILRAGTTIFYINRTSSNTGSAGEHTSSQIVVIEILA
jgi:hypothetical protein